MQTSIPFSHLPAIGAALDGGTFAGITTQPDGTHAAVALLPGRGENLNRSQATAWAAEQGGQLPTRAIAALLFANVKHLLPPDVIWCLETEGASYAWFCTFSYGHQDLNHKSAELSAVAVRMVPLSS